MRKRVYFITYRKTVGLGTYTIRVRAQSMMEAMEKGHEIYHRMFYEYPDEAQEVRRA